MQQAKQKIWFEKIYIELSDFCGLTCGFCPNAVRKERRGRMDLGLFERLCAEIRGKARRVCFHILGDPLGVEIMRYASIARQYDLSVELVSTGLFLKKEHFGLLVRMPFVQVAFSLSAFLANPRMLREEHLEQILKFCTYNLEQGSPIFINLRFHSADIAAKSPNYIKMLEMIVCCFRELNKAVDLAYVMEALECGERVRLGAKVFLNPTISFEWEREKDSSDIILERNFNSGVDSKKNGFEISESGTDLCDSEALEREISESRAFKCYGAIGQIGILSDGRVVPCCIDYEGRAAFGTLGEMSLGQILKTEQFLDFASKMKEGVMPHALCKGCGYWQRF